MEDGILCANEQPTPSQEFSPCQNCPLAHMDKEVCSIGCVKLERWQKRESYNRTDQIFYFDLKMPLKGCSYCGGKLVVEDGVTFCRDCMQVVTRLNEKNRKQRVLKMSREGFARRVIAELVGFSVSKCRKICTGERGLNGCSNE